MLAVKRTHDAPQARRHDKDGSKDLPEQLESVGKTLVGAYTSKLQMKHVERLRKELQLLTFRETDYERSCSQRRINHGAVKAHAVEHMWCLYYLVHGFPFVQFGQEHGLI